MARNISVLMELLKNKDITVDRLMFWGFCGTFFFIPIATSPAVIMGLLTLSLWIFSGKFIKDRHLWLKQKWFFPVLLFMALPWIGLLYTNDIKIGMDFAKKSYYWLYAFAIASLSCKKYPAKTMIYAFLFGLLFTAFITIMEAVGLVPMPKGMATGFMGHISFSLLLVFGILLVSFFYKTANNVKQRILLIMTMVIYFFSLSVGQGRIGYFAFLVLSPWIFFNIMGKKYIFKIAGAVLLIGLLLFSSSTVQNRVGLVVNDVKLYYHGNKNTSIGLRLYMWDGAAKLFLENPVIGVGTGGYKKAMMKYKDNPELPDIVQPHNSFLYMAVSFGIVGLFSLIWLFLVFLKKGWQARNSIVGFSVLSFGVVLLIGSLTDTQILSLATAKMLALLTGIRTEQDGS
jgi:O-antigen ligase